MSNNMFDWFVGNLNEIGFGITTVGTIAGVISLELTRRVNKKTNIINKNIDQFEIKAIFNSQRLIAIYKLKEIYSKYVERKGYKLNEIEEVLIDLEEFEKEYTDDFKDLLSKLKLLVDKTKSTNKPSPKRLDEVINIVYKITRKLENNLEVIKKEKI
ncbi:hypothetical protein [Lysinibacillus sp. K60]|uniref:hypothetical protein n=1 Tax=Lysinibacillus sp. K60 TaxID=2720027 RepID=UPI001C8C0E06|nr:hypothetical protein [Lysinibacillus sp. K60]MBX8944003.1 hypothetical protein [Lysinibacillus sp. K60]